jgi:AcrR family transcriptional regulator
MVAFTATASLRDRKKRETRDRIAAAAQRLFAERGFAAVTVAQIGAEAGVSAKTVFNYFPVKEGMFFAAGSPVDERLLRAVRDRPAGESAYDALCRRVVDVEPDPEGLAGAVRGRAAGESVLEAIERFHAERRPTAADPTTAAARARTYVASKELQAYVRSEFTRLEAALAGVLASDTAAPDGDPLPAVAAAALLAPARATYEATQRSLAAGAPPAAVAEQRLADMARAYALLAPALAAYARRPSP